MVGGRTPARSTRYSARPIWWRGRWRIRCPRREGRSWSDGERRGGEKGGAAAGFLRGPRTVGPGVFQRCGRVDRRARRSEEHTSELQSLRHLVCRLLLEKKKLQRSLSFCRLHDYLACRGWPEDRHA